MVNIITNLEKALVTSGQARDFDTAKIIYERMRFAVSRGSDPEDLLATYGLEPDYFFDLI